MGNDNTVLAGLRRTAPSWPLRATLDARLTPEWSVHGTEFDALPSSSPSLYPPRRPWFGCCLAVLLPCHHPWHEIFVRSCLRTFILNCFGCSHHLTLERAPNLAIPAVLGCCGTFTLPSVKHRLDNVSEGISDCRASLRVFSIEECGFLSIS